MRVIFGLLGALFVGFLILDLFFFGLLWPIEEPLFEMLADGLSV
ncbi:hypothetical protein [Halorubrum sodomense]|uniref:Uncharacterized protein n=1 Tax=Halorubrum sodomense TaxID=35743 RepID=A0A1I6HYA0_HALSD|nr:hypothetical protein [Halorubrum sodomense]SFR59446.1 hypothetical protein SAMN04487937_2976 [Halorubrum sodomense]